MADPLRSTVPVARSSRPAAADGWPRPLVVAVHIVSMVPVAAVLALAMATTLAYAVGWSPKIVTSGSMAPWMQPGDILLASPAHSASLQDGDVVVFAAPDAPGGQITHRLRDQQVDGSWITKGDANSRPDAQAVPPGAISGEVRAIIPRVGLPSLWIRNGEVVPLALWIGVLALSVWGMISTRRRASGILSSNTRRQAATRNTDPRLVQALKANVAAHPVLLVAAAITVGGLIAASIVGASLALSTGSGLWILVTMLGLALLIPAGGFLSVGLQAVRTPRR